MLVGGSVLASGTPAAVRSDPQVIAAYLGDESRMTTCSTSTARMPVTAPPRCCSASTSPSRRRDRGVLGRNGMGKTTTCERSWACCPRAAARSRFAGAASRGRPPNRIARAGIGLVPEGRQVFPTLTVEENLVATAASRQERPAGRSTRVFDLFPRLARARANIGNRCRAANSRCSLSAAR